MKPSRAMITGEISWAFVALCFAWSGSGLWPLETSYLYFMLHQQGLAYWWALIIGAPSCALFCVSLLEYVSTHDRRRDPLRLHESRWPPTRLERSARLRGRLCAALLLSWVYMAYFMVKLSARPSAILPVAIGGAVFALWFLIENRRVQRECKRRSHPGSAAAAG